MQNLKGLLNNVRNSVTARISEELDSLEKGYVERSSDANEDPFAPQGHRNQADLAYRVPEYLESQPGDQDPDKVEYREPEGTATNNIVQYEQDPNEPEEPGGPNNPYIA